MSPFDPTRRNDVASGMPQSVSPSRNGRQEPQRRMNGYSSPKGRQVGGTIGRLFPVLSRFSGITWEGLCRQVNGDLRFSSRNTELSGGTRFDLYEDGMVSLKTFMRSGRNGRLQSVEMRGQRINGPGSSIRLDMQYGPNTMIITELSPDMLLMNEVNKETGKILYTASLFLASDNELVQVSHQVTKNVRRVANNNMIMPIDSHQVWRLTPSQKDYVDKERDEWRNRREDDRAERARPMFPQEDSRSRINGRGGLPSYVPRRGPYNGFDSDMTRDQQWLLERTPEATRARFRENFDPMDLDDGDWDGPMRRDDEIMLSSFDRVIREGFPVLSRITGIDWEGSCRYIIGDTKADSILMLNGGMRYDLSDDGVCTMTTTVTLGDGRTRQVIMRGYRDPESRSTSMRLYPVDEDEGVYTTLTELSPDTILLIETERETEKVIYAASLSISSDDSELVQVTHEMGDGFRMPVEGHQIWRMTRYGDDFARNQRKFGSWVAGSSSSLELEELFPVLSKIEGTGWQGNFRFINGDLNRQTNFEATGKMWYDLSRNGTCVLTIVSSLADGSSRYVQMKGERPPGSRDPLRLNPVDRDGQNYMIVTELPPDTVLLSEIDIVTGKLVSTASLSLYRDEIVQVSHEIGNSTRLDGHQIARLRRTKERSSYSRGTMAYLLNGKPEEEGNKGEETLVDLFPVLNRIDGINWQGHCSEVDANMRTMRNRPTLSGGMRYDLHRNGTCTMTSVLMGPDGRTHEIMLQGTRVGKSNKRSIRLDPVSEDSPFYTVLTEVPPETILLNEVDKATNKVIFTASVTLASEDELVQISHEVEPGQSGIEEEGHKIWRLRRSPTLAGQDPMRVPHGRGAQGFRNAAGYGNRGPGFRGQGFPREPPRNGRQWRGANSAKGYQSDREKWYSSQPAPNGPNAYDARRASYGADEPNVPFGKRQPKDPNLMFDY